MSSLRITFIGTATAILEIDGVNFLTDPFFSPSGTEWDAGIVVLKNSTTLALSLEDLPVIDAVLLSHEDHPDNLDELGRRVLDGRRVFTTQDGFHKLSPRPGVQGMSPWEKVTTVIGGSTFEITATPCQHLPGGECIGFVLSGPGFGQTNGKPNGIFFSGDTVYIDELADIKTKFHIRAALLNLGGAEVPVSDPPLQITMNSKQAIRLVGAISPDVVVPMHCDGWGHFTEDGANAAQAFKAGGIDDRVRWLDPGKSTSIF
ncbi:Zn-dependent hydrolase [Polychaeton citri CBS 116435]|uniref:Zn-dependent hydrolase n=1 Tax=Polychaeton citri CBS 116435 TaxID=1314669 RepID=A0A9P4UIB8_9PEZI|nr:Zn-dependent hydrolase [Polychaeton citri CBS 116435]